MKDEEGVCETQRRRLEYTMYDGADCTLENALVYKALGKVLSLYRPLTFYLQNAEF